MQCCLFLSILGVFLPKHSAPASVPGKALEYLVHMSSLNWGHLTAHSGAVGGACSALALSLARDLLTACPYAAALSYQLRPFKSPRVAGALAGGRGWWRAHCPRGFSFGCLGDTIAASCRASHPVGRQRLPLTSVCSSQDKSCHEEEHPMVVLPSFLHLCPPESEVRY